MENTSTTTEEVKNDNVETPKEPTVEVKTESKFQKFKRKFKSFAKTRKGKIVLGVGGILTVGSVIGLVLLLSKKPGAQEPNIQVSETIASDKIYDNYDFVYSSEDTRLIATTYDGAKQLELVIGEAKILDYIISPDKRKITYVLSDVNYKNKITSPNVDITKFNFYPVGFSIYQLDLETGDNSLIWSRDRIELPATNQRLYKQKEVILPDSYAIGYDWNGMPYSYPVSYSEFIDDIEGGYISTYLPYDLSMLLTRGDIRLINYSDTGASILFLAESKLFSFSNTSETLAEISGEEQINNCFPGYLRFFSNIIFHHTQCGTTIFSVTNNSLAKYSGLQVNNGELKPLQATTQGNLLAEVNYYGYPRQSPDSLNFVNLSTNSINKIQDLADEDSAKELEVIRSENIYTILASDITEPSGQIVNQNIKLMKYNADSNLFEVVSTLILPADAGNLIYDESTNSLTFFITYRSTSQVIIEYKTVNLETMKETLLSTTKAPSDSVLVYRPKLLGLRN